VRDRPRLTVDGSMLSFEHHARARCKCRKLPPPPQLPKPLIYSGGERDSNPRRATHNKGCEPENRIPGGASLQMIENAYFRFIPTEMIKKLVAIRAKGNGDGQKTMSK
jgi:hypothetical protein